MKRSTLFGIVGLVLVCTSAFALGNAYFRSLGIGGGYNSLGDGGANLSSNGNISTNGAGLFEGGIQAFGGSLTAVINLLVDETQVGLFTAGTTEEAGTLFLNGTFAAIQNTDWESPTGFLGAITIEDFYGYGERPTLSLVDVNNEGLRLHYDLDHTTTADLFDDDEDTLFRVENSDGTYKANASVEGQVSAESAAITKGGVFNNLEIRDWSAGATWAEIRHDDNDDAYLQFRNTGETNLASGPGTDLTLLPGNDAGDAATLQAGTGDLLLPADIKVAGNDINLGDAGGFSGVKFAPGTTTLDFYIDGVKVGHIGTSGAYTDDVP